MWENGKYLSRPMEEKIKQPDIFMSSGRNLNRDNLGPIYVPKKGDVFPIHEDTNWKYLLPIMMMEGYGEMFQIEIGMQSQKVKYQLVKKFY